MRELTQHDLHEVAGGITLGGVWRATAPLRGVAGAASLGWMVGSAIYRTYDDEIQAGLEYVLG